MKFLWISGWAVSPVWFAEQARAHWPEAEHQAVSPSEAPAAIAQNEFTAVGGYSLGALWLLSHSAIVPKNVPVVLLAPIFAFPAELAGGGRMTLTHLRWQRKRLRNDAPAALADFFQRAGLTNEVPPPDQLTPAQIALLDDELGWLETLRAPAPPPPTWLGVTGGDDSLTDATKINSLWPAVHIISAAGHAPGPLLRSARELFLPPHQMKEVIQNFDRSVAGYEAHSAPQAALAVQLASWLTPAEHQGRAVEFGAGTGLFTRHMLPWAGTYLATDAAPRMVEYGREHLPAMGWQIHDARQTTGLATVDWIFSCNLLQWLDDPATVLREWRKILPPGGKLVAAILLPGSLGELQTILPRSTPLRWHSADEWQMMCGRANFSVIREATWEHREIYSHALAFMRAVHAMGLAPHRSVGGGQLRTALRAYDRNFATAGGVGATWQAWLVRAMAV